jgi:hypothetical protein
LKRRTARESAAAEEELQKISCAIEDGRLSEQWLDETVLRILEFKQQHKLLN